MADVDDLAGARTMSALRALSDLTPSAERKDDALTVPLDWFRWLDDGLQLFGYASPGDPLDEPSPTAKVIRELAKVPTPTYPTVGVEREFGERLAAVQQLRGEAAVRVGWLWLAGSANLATASGEQRRVRVFHPLVTRAARVIRRSALGGWGIHSFGDPEITPLITDRDVARRYEQVQTGGGAFSRPSELTPSLLARLTHLQQYATGLATAAGFHGSTLAIDTAQPQSLMRADGLRVVVGCGVYAVGERAVTTRAGSLQAWAETVNTRPTAFHAVYSEAEYDDDEATELAVESPLPLTRLQRSVVEHVRRHAVTVVSGAPGTGKSHTVAAVVADALRRGRSVLVTAKTDAAVDAVIALLDRQPGLSPVVFGASERRDALAMRLAALSPAPAADIATARQQLDAAQVTRDRALEAARAALRPEELLTPAGASRLEQARALCPAAFTGPVDLRAAEELAATATEQGGWWFGRRRRRRAARQLRALLGSPAEAAPREMLEAARLAAARIVLDEHPTPAARCAELERAEARVATSLAAWLGLQTRSADRLDRGGLAAIGALSTALRSGRAARRAQLARMRDNRLTSALPLWVGTLTDVDDLLPPLPALFDLVVVDEASAVEQTLAAPALLRGRQALVVGDPHQLRHVSFVGDSTIAEVLDRHGVDGAHRSQLDVRRNSLFDAAAASTPMILLDEHFRSAPHLIDVVAERIYSGRVKVATRTPLTHDIDCIHLLSVNGRRDGAGVIHSEVHAAVEEVRRLHSAGATSVGVLTPFRAQADALEAAMLAAFNTADLMAMDLRVGTVHSFQGNERKAVVCSLGLTDDDAGGWAFVANPNLLAVMLTRARSRMVVLSSCTPRPDSLLGAYLARANTPPGAPSPAHVLPRWAERVAEGLADAGTSCWRAYPTGRHVVDLAATGARHPVAVVCGLHPDGVDAHVDRHLSLLRGGWKLVDALESRWEDRTAELVLELRHQLASDTLGA